MTTTALSLTFYPAPWTPEGAGDFQQLQALFKAAAEVRRVPGNLQTIGDPTISIAYEFWLRVAHRQVDPSSPQTVLEYLSANYPGIATKIADPVDTIEGMGRTARFQDAAIEALTRRVDERDAEIARLKVDVQHEHLRVVSLTNELAQARGELLVEEGKVARLTEELARRLAQVADARVAEFDPGSIEAYEQGIRERVLAIPGVLRVHWPQWGTLRALVAFSETPEVIESIEVQIEAVIDDPEIEHRVQREPGEPAPGYKVRPGDRNSPLLPAPFYWRHESDDAEHEQGPLESEAAAVDATWDEHTADTAESMGDGP
jgi:hypothetical protein